MTCAVEFSFFVLTLVRVWTSLLLTMRQAVSIVHYITNNIDGSSFVFYPIKIYDFSFLLRCIKQTECRVFFSELRLYGIFVEWTLQCFLKQWKRGYDNHLPLAIRSSRILSLKTKKDEWPVLFFYRIWVKTSLVMLLMISTCLSTEK